jgi:serine/threonine protein kinase/tetratricopeptide (TPR) repeat protein
MAQQPKHADSQEGLAGSGGPDDAGSERPEHASAQPTRRMIRTGPPPSDPDAGPRGALPLERGTHVERYVILKSVGKGGMGVVYAAYDPELDRKVALKLLLPNQEGPEEVGRARLLREAQAMARISHPNVITVHDVGTFGDQVFVAMEFIQGSNLQEWVRKGGHTWQELVRVFLEAGRGLAAAHKAGLVHRDFKPANVLIGNGSRVYVTDFGLARLASEHGEEDEAAASREAGAPPVPRSGSGLSSELTAAGIALGTPHYMPPEQYLGPQVDARSDQFSFCVSLYHALYGKRPFEHQAVARLAAEAYLADSGTLNGAVLRGAAQSAIIREPPREPRVPAWVRRAVMRGLSLHPEDRFPSMEALLDALSQQQRQANRRGALVAAGALGLASLGLGAYLHHQSQVCAGADSLAGAVWNPTARQKLEAAFTATGKPFAGETASRVAQRLDGYARDWARMHTEACEATRVREEQTESLLSLRMVCLERRRKDLGALVGQLSDADGKVVERAVDATAALPSLQPCSDIESLTDQTPRPADPARQATIERLEEQVAEVKALFDAGRFPKALELAKALKPEVDAAAWLPLRAELGNHLGWLQQQMGEVDEGIRELERAFDAAESSRSDRLRVELLTRLIFALANHGKAEQAERWGQVAQAVLARIGGDPLLAVDLLGNMGTVQMIQGRYAQGKELIEKARALQQDVASPEDPKRARVTYSLGLAAMRMGEHERAIQLLTEALDQTAAAKGRTHPEMGNRYAMLSNTLREHGDAAQALVHAKAALEVRKTSLGDGHPLVADALDGIGMCLLDLKRHDEALATFQEAVELKRETQGPDSSDLTYSYDGVGQALLAQGRAKEAVAPLRQALAYEDAEPEALAGTGFVLAKALQQAGDAPESWRQEALRARKRYEELEKPEQVKEIDTWLASAQAQVQAEAPRSKAVRPAKHTVKPVKKKRPRSP